ncbi:MAG: hypothetical protein IPK83_04625 [Planctomycetes bacterium]|nr:hypothetical protein [Planctomycetota bacterium]
MLLAILAGACICPGALERAPGRNSLLSGLAGDWSFEIDNSGYEIGNDSEKSGKYCIIRWKEILFEGERILDPELIANGVNRYYVDDTRIIVETDNEIVTLDMQNHSAARRPKNRLSAEEDHRFRVPRPSYRLTLYFVGGGLLLAALIRFALIRKSVRMNMTQ